MVSFFLNLQDLVLYKLKVFDFVDCFNGCQTSKLMFGGKTRHVCLVVLEHVFLSRVHA